MIGDPLAASLAQALADAQRRYRTRRGYGALVTPAVPTAYIEELAAALAPIIRQAVDDQLLLLVAEQRAARDNGRRYPLSDVMAELDARGSSG